MMRTMPRAREHHTKPESGEKRICVKLMIPKSSAVAMRELERRQYTREDIFLAGIRAYEER